ncbi:hypothetical protein [Paenibacillus macquariensis]|uniref:hypothetical protein n=1 Tax=Paenibacillus macquariensis TaxID=948756 RepID=UPI0014712F72|nr:hypothetical protein [Paenibacillus macquariensis]
MLRRPLRERIVLPIAVVPGFPNWIPPTAVEIRGQAYAFEEAFLRKACRRPLRFLQNNSVLYAGTTEIPYMLCML